MSRSCFLPSRTTVKKSTQKKSKAKGASKRKRAAGKSSVSLKNRNSKPKSIVSATAPKRRKAAASPRKNSLRKPASPPSIAHLQQKGVSQNGKLPAENTRKTRKSQIEFSPGEKPSEVQIPVRKSKVRTNLSAKELREFKAMLLDKRAELAGDVEHLTSEALNRKNSGVNEQSSMPIHMADLGSDTWEQDFTLGLIANEQALVREIDEALERIEDRTYGMCVATDKPISVERLRAKPWAKYCIEYARLREEGRAP